ncbi:hypothetical protein TPHA_0C02970 [Tetrapisispora phaffii CBS 4417]|uniref:Aminopeptidase n=1 Tax=Tetrapisispora phaffii (strain ATCC 24235 / CBS 4417 / NBRC 1672 / NRRL Y-8282 / UCD 70-5) TaxID=1071381 RepID=G8BRS4_TETPH|nr:hypothetical protein TPHA_0C02970 [Tetrapisispora phaffii CBS 4417]CCE62450.1 hypothetical protein TPHA_0C02970 [Tetrapisispora phaffii CBS 4417]
MSVQAITNGMSLLTLDNPVLPSHYEIKLNLEPNSVTAKSSIKITMSKNDKMVASAKEDLKQFRLHSKDLKIANAFIVDEDSNKKLLLKWKEDVNTNLLTLNSEEAIPFKDNHFFLHIEYDATVKIIKTHEDKTYGIFKTNFMKQSSESSIADNVIISTHCQPSYAKTIFPCVDEPSIKTSFQLTLETPSQFKTISNTGIKSEEKLKSGRTVTTFKTTPLMSTSVFGFAAGDFDFIKSEVEMPISKKKIPLCVYAPDNIDFTVFTLDTIQKYLPLLENYFNKEYPLDKLDFVLLPFLSDMAMENFGMVSILMNHLTLPPQALANDNIREQCQQLIVHELVHQWFGNFITYESWEYLWFNESFATWLASVLLTETGDSPSYWTSNAYLQQHMYITMENEISNPSILSIIEQSKRSMNSEIIETSDVFNAHSYAKGIAILRSLQLTIGDELLKKGIQTFINDEKNHTHSIKPMDMWTQVGSTLKSANIANYFASWSRLQGVPIVHVEVETDGNNEISYKLTQHRYYHGEQDEIEDIPYHIPLFILNEDGSEDRNNVLFTDRTLIINGKKDLVLLNHNGQGYYKVSYESETLYDSICKQLLANKLNGVDLFTIMKDIKSFIGDEKYQKPIHFDGLFKILRTLCSPEIQLDETSVYWYGLNVGLDIIQKIDRYERTFKNVSMDKISQTLTSEIFIPFMNKIDWPKDFSKIKENVSTEQLECMSQIMFLNRQHGTIIKKCDTYFQKMLNGPKQCIPIELVNSILTVYCSNMTSLKQWKKLINVMDETSESNKEILQHLIENSDNLNKYEINFQFIKNSILENIGFTSKEELMERNLRYINEHIGSMNIEYILIGINYNSNGGDGDANEKNIKSIEEWYLTNLPNWIKIGMKLKNTIKNISLIVFQIVNNKKSFVDKLTRFKGNSLGIDFISYYSLATAEINSQKLIIEDLNKVL